MPAPLREALEKAEVSGAKQITKDLPAATSSLGRARKAYQEASDARKQLKSTWMKHLEESLKAWEGQLDTYRSNLAQLQDAEAKALQDVAVAKKTIQQLNAQADTSSVEDAAVMEEAMEPNTEKEEEKARQKLAGIMKTCLASVGVEMKNEVTEIISDDEKDQPAKRPRSVDPGALKSGALPSS